MRSNRRPIFLMNIPMKIKLSQKIILALLGVSGPASLGADFYPISGVTSDTAGTDFFPALNMIEGPGVGFETAEPHNRTSGLTWVTNAPNGGTGDYYSPVPVPGPRLVFDLGSAVELNEISIWGYADGNGNGLISADLRFSETTTFTGEPVSITGITQPVAPRQSFAFPQVTARYVELVPTDNLFGIAPPGGDRVGIGEVAFAVPQAEADLAVTNPASLNLAETGVQSFPIPVFNVGGSELTISEITVTGANANAVSVTSFPATIGAGGDEDIVIEINANILGPGGLDAVLEIASNDFEDAVTNVMIEAGLPFTFNPIAAVQTNTVDFYLSDNLIAGIGNGFESFFPHNAIGGGETAAWVTDAPNGAGDYYDNDIPDPVIIFDLGANVPIGEINTWGYSATNTNGAKEYTLRFATEAEGGDPALGDEDFGNSISDQPSFEADFSPVDRDVEVFEQPVLARYVEMTITDNWRDFQGAMPGGDRVGLGEVAFPVFTGSFNPPLGIVSATRENNGDFSVTFFSAEGVSYELERSIDGIDWDRLPVSINGSPDEISTITDTDPLPDADTVLYRVVQP